MFVCVSVGKGPKSAALSGNVPTCLAIASAAPILLDRCSPGTTTGTGDGAENRKKIK